MTRIRIPLLMAGAVFAALGLVLLVLPPRVGQDIAPAISEPPPTLPSMPPGDPALAENLVLANVFSSRRAPPATRYAPLETATETSGGTVADTTATGAAMDAVVAGPRLFGTLVGGQGAQALLQLDASRPGALLYAVGDRDGGYRVISITPRTVVLAGPRGRVTLRIDSEEERP